MSILTTEDVLNAGILYGAATKIPIPKAQLLEHLNCWIARYSEHEWSDIDYYASKFLRELVAALPGK